jgi:hypothetical protein
MKRDMELVRKILFKIEDEYKPGDGYIRNLKVEGYEYLTIAEHCDLMERAGLIKHYKPTYADNTIYMFSVGNLTNEGHDYLENIRNEKVWEQTKEDVKKNGIAQTIENFGIIAAKIAGAFVSQYLE